MDMKQTRFTIGDSGVVEGCRDQRYIIVVMIKDNRGALVMEENISRCSDGGKVRWRGRDVDKIYDQMVPFCHDLGFAVSRGREAPMRILGAQQTRCNAVEVSWCLQAIVANMRPSRNCCQRLKGQENCLCRETHDPTFGGYLRLPGARRVANECGVNFPTCT
ncbi:Bifunctional inhibitor/plant lipid transfer protein/seed storage helical domain-containing protein [Cynara cardunculus var. scolymus]|uniref:Bifunctional inhibitor/plant lipid transfer protein/seed storage helical domain-containing protein n=1 Tax=Cynara cardunculus var. scolymus TaxID=59895 RepID=A0A124SEH7_CYNCS|nr:Bifunctional inhibitor/plant lipid transfer protein/seed storage helical domain-containing protein [Cynara cardunculus var. scolymus]